MTRPRTRWRLGVALVAMAGVGLVLAIAGALLAQNPERHEALFLRLFWVSVGVAGVLAAVILAALVVLGVQVGRGKFGSRLLLKLAVIFALVGVVPGALLYTVSVQVVLRSGDAWFDSRVANALDAGLVLGKGSLDALAADLTEKTRQAAERYADRQASEPQLLLLERLREDLGAESLDLVSANGRVLASAGAQTDLLAARPDANLLAQARLRLVASRVEGLDDDAAAPNARVQVLAWVPSADSLLAPGNERYLMAVRPLPATLARNALLVQAAYRDYQQRVLARDGLRRVYVGTLTLTLVLSVFGAVVLAAVLGNQIARPLLWLAQGMRRVAAGDLQAVPAHAANDEVGDLTRSFATMTEQLGSARAQAQRSLTELESASTRLQTILDNLTAGVLMLDASGRLDAVNPGATRILRLPVSAHLGQALASVPNLGAMARWLDERFEALAAQPEPGERDEWQDAFEWPRVAGGDAKTLLVRGAQLPGAMRLVVFDDITDLLAAQRSAAWGEVARRVAHEIKNPLTPIQLSAERLQHKLEPRLTGDDQAMLVRAVTTIVNQVQAMKTLVNEFRDYARLPSAQLGDVDLNALVAEVLALYGDAQEAGRLASVCQSDLPLVRGDASQLRQVVHNLVQNALDAVESQPDGQVRVATELARYDDGRPRVVRLVVTDNGPGFAEGVAQRAFEPYVTTKAKGTGLGLAVVKKIADEHGARVRIVNRTPPATDPSESAAALDVGGAGPGAQVSLSFPSFTSPQTAEPTPWPPSL